MKNRLVSIGMILAGLSLATFAQAQGSLEGAWQLQELRISGSPNEGTNADPDLHLLFFTGRHYSRIVNFAARPNVSQGGPVTDEDRIANYITFRANSGTYEVSGSKLMLHFMLALNPAAVGFTEEVEYRIEGDKLIITATPDEDVVTRRTYTRLD